MGLLLDDLHHAIMCPPRTKKPLIIRIEESTAYHNFLNNQDFMPILLLPLEYQQALQALDFSSFSSLSKNRYHPRHHERKPLLPNLRQAPQFNRYSRRHAVLGCTRPVGLRGSSSRRSRRRSSSSHAQQRCVSGPCSYRHGLCKYRRPEAFGQRLWCQHVNRYAKQFQELVPNRTDVEQRDSGIGSTSRSRSLSSISQP